MTNPLAPLVYGSGPYPYTLRMVVASYGVPGWSAVLDVSLAQFPLDENNAPDPAAIQTYIEERNAAYSGFEFQILTHLENQVQPSTSYPSFIGTTNGVIDGIDAINAYLGTDIVLTGP